jgi:hypothetical protein
MGLVRLAAACHDGDVVGHWKLTRVCLDQDSVQVSTPCGDSKSSSAVTEIPGYTATAGAGDYVSVLD